MGGLIAAIKRRQGRWQDALEAYERSQKIDPQDPNIVRELVYTNTALRRWPEASHWAAQWRTMTPVSVIGKIQSGWVDFLWKGDTALLKSLLSEVPSGTDPEANANITVARWDVAMVARDYEAAKRVLDASPATEKPFPPKSFWEGCTFLAQGDARNAQKFFEAALSFFEAAVKEAPDDAARRADLGRIYAFMGRRDDAIREGRLAVELKPESKDAFDGVLMNCYLTLIYARVGEKDLALPLIERLLKTPGAVDSTDASITINDLKYRWEWDPLRDDPRFQRLVAGKAQ